VSAPKITTAQRTRLLQAAAGAITKVGQPELLRGYFQKDCRVCGLPDGSSGAGTYVMWGNLERAGFVEWAPEGNNLFRAVLTDAGRAALATKGGAS
jgi:hypothetical protein